MKVTINVCNERNYKRLFTEKAAHIIFWFSHGALTAGSQILWEHNPIGNSLVRLENRGTHWRIRLVKNIGGINPNFGEKMW